MNQSKSQTANPLPQAALQLDKAFGDFIRLAHELDKVEIDSDYGFGRAQKLLVQLQELGQGIGTGLTSLSEIIINVKDQTEEAAKKVSASATKIVERQGQMNALTERLSSVGNNLQALLEQDKLQAVNHLPEISEKLENLAGEIKNIINEARAFGSNAIEKSADLLRRSLLKTQRQIDSIVKDSPSTTEPRSI